MAKSIRSKVKKRLRTVKRGILKDEKEKTGTFANDREIRKKGKIAEALSGHLKYEKKAKSAFRYDDEDAVIPQHDWRQGPDFRSAFASSDANLGVVVGASRPKQMHGGDAPGIGFRNATAPAPSGDGGLTRLLRTTEQIAPYMANKKTKRRLKGKAADGASANEKAAFRWT